MRQVTENKNASSVKHPWLMFLNVFAHIYNINFYLFRFITPYSSVFSCILCQITSNYGSKTTSTLKWGLIDGLTYPSKSQNHITPQVSLRVRDNCTFTYNNVVTRRRALVTNRHGVATGRKEHVNGRHGMLYLIYSVACKQTYSPAFLPGCSEECTGQFSHALWLLFWNAPKEMNR